ncbi:hypothetical protein ADK74_17090 [Streptomyces decoyicus]|nr:hypothetical protein ADK74_17090 [Streptomyces decoyicus]
MAQRAGEIRAAVLGAAMVSCPWESRDGLPVRVRTFLAAGAGVHRCTDPGDLPPLLVDGGDGTLPEQSWFIFIFALRLDCGIWINLPVRSATAGARTTVGLARPHAGG